MKDSVARVLGGIGIVAFFISGWRAFQSPALTTTTAGPVITAKGSAQADKAHTARHAESATGKRSMAAVRGGDEPLVKEKALAEKLSIRLTSSESGALTIHESTIALLRLTPNQAHELNVSLTIFLERLRSEEVKHAYVKVSADGSEEIVVAPFERTELMWALIVELNDRLGAAIADFVNERLPYDLNLLVSNFEMRTYIEKYPDGLDREVFERTQPTKSRPITLPGPAGERVVPSPSTTKFRTIYFARDGHPFHTRHLWAAVDQLPRRGPEASKK